MQELLNRKQILIGFLGLIGMLLLIWTMIYFFSPQPQLSKQDKQKLEQISKENKQLEKQQQKLEKKIEQLEKQTTKIDSTISKNNQKLPPIRKKYQDKSQQIVSYDKTQLDSLFKARYNY